MVAIDGLVSGLDTTTIIDALLQSYQVKIDLLVRQKQEALDQQEAFKSIEANLLTLQGALVPLASSIKSVFDQKTATVSDEDALTAAASRTATPGTYTLTILQLAQAHQIATQGFSSPTAKITQGTLTIQVGNGAATTITIDSTNDTLQGLADAINSAGIGVTATVIHDGSPEYSAPYRLLLTADEPGAANQIKITNALAADTGTAIKPVFSGTYIGDAVTDPGFAGTSTVTSNRGAGNYTGNDNDTYTFTVQTGGTVGTDTIVISYSDGSGTNSGTLTVNPSDVDTFLNVAEGVQVKFSAGTLVAGDTFTIDVYVTELQQAQNARIALGSGAGALVAESSTNTFDQLIPGVTLDVQKADPAKPITVTVSRDVDAAVDAVQAFVDAFNETMDFIDEQLYYDPETGEEGPLLGEFSAVQIQEAIRTAVVQPVQGLLTGVRTLSAVGLRLEDNGKLSLDAGKLRDALLGQLDNVTPEDVKRLFAIYGESSNPGIRFVTGSIYTKASSTPYQVDIIQAAERASITATNAVTGTITINATNNTFQIRVDKRDSAVLTIPDGTYTLEQIALVLEDLINSDENISPASVEVTVSGNQLVITSTSYGYESEVTVLGGTALASLGFSGSETDRGRDVAGSFIVNGQTEPAVGRGQILTGLGDNEYTADLQLRVTLTPSQVQPGIDGTIHVTSGIANELAKVLGELLDPVDGRLKRLNQRFTDEIDAIDDAIRRQEERRDLERDALVRKFALLETTLSDLQNLTAMLAAQLQAVSLG